jgi:hypothetical protein
MKVRFFVSIAGLAEPRYDQHYDFSFRPGEIATIHPDHAKGLIESGVCEAVEPAEAIDSEVAEDAGKAKRGRK